MDGLNPDSDWDFAIYYRDRFDPDDLRAKGWGGEISEVGGWGGGVMNGGAWLEVDGRRVDAHYRNLDDVEHWCPRRVPAASPKSICCSTSPASPPTW